MAKYTVIGAGNGGLALAGYLSLQQAENDVILYNRSAAPVAGIRERGLEIEGCFKGRTECVHVTDSLEEALTNTRVVMVCIPANCHGDLAVKMKKYLKSGQMIVLNPGRTFGAFLFDKIIQGRERGISVAETDTFLLTARKIADCKSRIFFKKKQVFLSSADMKQLDRIYDVLVKDFPMLKKAGSILYVSFANIGSILHPLPALLNFGRIEHGEKFLYYKEGITPVIAKSIQKLDEERVMLALKAGVRVPSAEEWLKDVYGSFGAGLYEKIQNTKAYDEVMAPTDIATRYIYEDIETGIAPMCLYARDIGIKCAIMESIVDFAANIFNYDFFKEAERRFQALNCEMADKKGN